MSVGEIQPLTTCHPLRSADVTPLPRYYGTIRLLPRLRSFVVAFLRPTARADPRRSLGVRLSNFSPSPPSLPPGHDRISGVVLEGTLALARKPRQGFTCVRICDTLPASIPHALTGKAEQVMLGLLRLVQLPSARGCLRWAPQRTRTSIHSTMPNAPPRDVAALRPRSAAPGPTVAGKTCAFCELSPSAGARAGILIVAEVQGWLSPITRSG